MQYVYLPNKLQHQNNKILKESKSILQHWKIHFAIPGRKSFPSTPSISSAFRFRFSRIICQLNLWVALSWHLAFSTLSLFKAEHPSLVNFLAQFQEIWIFSMLQGFLYWNVQQHQIHWSQMFVVQCKYVWAHGAISCH